MNCEYAKFLNNVSIENLELTLKESIENIWIGCNIGSLNRSDTKTNLEEWLRLSFMYFLKEYLKIVSYDTDGQIKISSVDFRSVEGINVSLTVMLFSKRKMGYPAKVRNLKYVLIPYEKYNSIGDIIERIDLFTDSPGSMVGYFKKNSFKRKNG